MDRPKIFQGETLDLPKHAKYMSFQDEHLQGRQKVSVKTEKGASLGNTLTMLNRLDAVVAAKGFHTFHAQRRKVWL